MSNQILAILSQYLLYLYLLVLILFIIYNKLKKNKQSFFLLLLQSIHKLTSNVLDHNHLNA